MNKSKRSFLGGISGLAASLVMLPSSYSFATQLKKKESPQKARLGMVIDLRKCIGCHSCTVSCGVENSVPPTNFRTKVDEIYVDANDNGQNYYLNLPSLCNHCEKPACVPVCPTGATFKRTEDGRVLIDNKVCIGCGFCVQACPYAARFINTETNVADKCTFCAHRMEKGLLPACVESCVGNARIIGNLNQPDSYISQIIKENDIAVLKAELGTEPNVFYIGLPDIIAKQAWKNSNQKFANNEIPTISMEV